MLLDGGEYHEVIVTGALVASQAPSTDTDSREQGGGLDKPEAVIGGRAWSGKFLP